MKLHVVQYIDNIGLSSDVLSWAQGPILLTSIKFNPNMEK